MRGDGVTHRDFPVDGESIKTWDVLGICQVWEGSGASHGGWLAYSSFASTSAMPMGTVDVAKTRQQGQWQAFKRNYLKRCGFTKEGKMHPTPSPDRNGTCFFLAASLFGHASTNGKGMPVLSCSQPHWAFFMELRCSVPSMIRLLEVL